MTCKVTWNTSKSPVVFDRPNVLLVEGQDDLAFAASQIEQVQMQDEFQVHVMGGNKKNWRAQVSVILDDDWFSLNGRSLGVVLDADLSLESAFQSGCSMIRDVGVPVPSAPGVVATRAHMKAGVAGGIVKTCGSVCHAA